MKRFIRTVLLAPCLILTLGLTLGCDGEDSREARTTICADHDGDGFGIYYNAGAVGGAYGAPTTDCSTAQDCNDDDASNWDKCGSCEDKDGDNSFVFCNSYVNITGPDCDDANPNMWDTCDTCGDGDGDGFWGNCNAYIGIPGPDQCEVNTPVGPNQWRSPCARCIDPDGDRYFYGCDSFAPGNTIVVVPTLFLGKDNCEGDPNNWTLWGCANCRDDDRDSNLVDCDFYPGGGLPDACDNDPFNWLLADCNSCADNDLDGYWSNCGDYSLLGNGAEDNCDNPVLRTDRFNYTLFGCTTCADLDGDSAYDQCDSYAGLGISIRDNCDVGDPIKDPNNWTVGGCAGCTTADGDSWYVNCDVYNTINGPDACDANTGVNGNNWKIASCINCLDADTDTYYMNCDAYDATTVKGPDCTPFDRDHWYDCGACVDNDGDAYGNSCDRGLDCDDTTTTGAGCNSTCNTYYLDSDGDGFGDLATNLDACTIPPGAYVGDSTDCDVTSNAHWDDCATCIDGDTDDYGAGCNLGPDCDDDPITGPSCNAGCQTYFIDVDLDSYGNSVLPGSSQCISDGDTIDNTDCNDGDSHHWSDCGSCTDIDGDDYGASCDLGPDCDDSTTTGPTCYTACPTYYPDADGDNHGNTVGGTLQCVGNGATIDNTDCDDGDSAHWDDCGMCIDNDGDNYGIMCSLGMDCDDSTTTGAGCTSTCTQYYRDADGDGVGTTSDMLNACSVSAGYTTNCCDCDDSPATGSTCDLMVYSGETLVSTDCSVYYPDVDGDGYGDTMDSGEYQCFANGNTTDSSDCSDLLANVWDSCSTCDITDGDSDRWAVGDTCDGPQDCNDADPAINPGATEITCNMTDENCNGNADNSPNVDGDAYDLCDPGVPGDDTFAADCNDGDSTIYPGAAEITCSNTADENCNGMADNAPNVDGDAYDICTLSDPGNSDGLTADCNDGVFAINPGAAEIPCSNTVDENCNGMADNAPDADSDTYDLCAPADPGDIDGRTADCNDADTTINPGHAEILCDTIDQNCNGLGDDNKNTDGDSLLYCDEVIYGTDDTKVDTDGDGLSDYLEAVTVLCLDATSTDTDSDGLCDGNVTVGSCVAGEDMDLNGDTSSGTETDPCDPDTDADSLTDGDEVNVYFTDPLLADTDGDSLTDYFEVCYDNDCTTYDAGRDTNPNSGLTDGDSLTDGEEINYTPKDFTCITTADVYVASKAPTENGWDADDTGDAIADAQAEDANRYRVNKDKFMHFDTVQNTIPGSAAITEVYLEAKWNTQGGYSGTNSVMWSTNEGATKVTSSIQPFDTATFQIESIDITASRSWTPALIQETNIFFENNDGGGGDWVQFDYVRLKVKYADCGAAAPGCTGTTYNGHNYLYCTGPLGWAASRSFCQSLGGDLAAVDSAGENNDIITNAAANSWIGYNDITADDSWVWSHGSQIIYTNWVGGTPPVTNNALDCAQILNPGGTWDDVDCAGVLPFVCEDGFGLNPFESDTDFDGMPDGWEVFYISCMDPFVDDAADNPDSDADDNMTEYTNDTDPCNP